MSYNAWGNKMTKNNTFTCVKCGHCRENINNSKGLPFDPTSKPRDNFKVTLEPLSTGGLVLFPWEREPLIKLAKKMGVKVDIRLSAGLFSKTDKSIVIVEYILHCDKCPFLSNSKTCDIYNDRPLICRTFPIMSTGLIIPKLPIIVTSSCPNNQIPNINTLLMSKYEIFEKLFALFGKNFEWALKYDNLVMEWRGYLGKINNHYKLWNQLLPRSEQSYHCQNIKTNIKNWIFSIIFPSKGLLEKMK